MKLVFAQQRNKNIKEHKCPCIFEYRSCTCLLVFWSSTWLTSSLICNIDHFLWWNTIQQLHLLQPVKDKSFLAHSHRSTIKIQIRTAWIPSLFQPCPASLAQHHSYREGSVCSFGKLPASFLQRNTKTNEDGTINLFLSVFNTCRWHPVTLQ